MVSTEVVIVEVRLADSTTVVALVTDWMVVNAAIPAPVIGRPTSACVNAAEAEVRPGRLIVPVPSAEVTRPRLAEIEPNMCFQRTPWLTLASSVSMVPLAERSPGAHCCVSRTRRPARSP